jgi:hypothetical protein
VIFAGAHRRPAISGLLPINLKGTHTTFWRNARAANSCSSTLDPGLIGQYYGSDYYAHAGLNNRKPNLKARLRNRFLDGLGGYDRSSLSGRLIRSFVPRDARCGHHHSQSAKGKTAGSDSQQSILMSKSRDGGEDCSAGTSAV